MTRLAYGVRAGRDLWVYAPGPDGAALDAARSDLPPGAPVVVGPRWADANAVAAALAVAPAADAFEFVTGNEDLSIRFDNTVRVNVTGRAASPDEAILGNVNFDDGDRNFDSGALFERFDLLTEFDFVWKRQAGFRVSAASWWDGGYQSLDGNSLATSNSLEHGLPTLDLDPHAERYAKGPSAETNGLVSSSCRSGPSTPRGRNSWPRTGAEAPDRAVTDAAKIAAAVGKRIVVSPREA